MNKSYIPLTVVGAVSLVAVLAIGGLAGYKFSNVSSAEVRLKKAQSKLEQLAKKTPYPSSENNTTADANLASVEKSIKGLEEIISEEVIKPRKTTYGEFMDSRTEVILALVKDAPMGDGSDKPVVNDTCQFGFSAYATGVPPKDSDSPRLQLQLELIDKLVRIIYASGVISLDGVGREVFESATAGQGSSSDEDSSPSRRRRNRSSGDSTGKAIVEDLRVDKVEDVSGAVVMSRMRFKFAVTTREAGLKKLLNSFDSMTPYAVISSLLISKCSNDDVIFPDEIVDPRAEESARKEAENSSKPVLREKPAPRTARLVSGPLREVPVKVEFCVDVYALGKDLAAEQSDNGEED